MISMWFSMIRWYIFRCVCVCMHAYVYDPSLADGIYSVEKKFIGKFILFLNKTCIFLMNTYQMSTLQNNVCKL